MSVRTASIEDIPLLVSLVQDFYAENHPQFPFDKKATREWLEENIGHEERYIVILNEGDGILLGGVTPTLFAEQLLAQEIIWYTRKSARGHGLKLFRSFEKWAEEKNVAGIHFGLSTENPVLERMGYYMANVSYMKRIA